MPNVRNTPRWNGGIAGQSARNRQQGYNATGATHGTHGTTRQGQGEQGRINQAPTDEVDTTKMSPEEKLKYFQSLGLIKNIAK